MQTNDSKNNQTWIADHLILEVGAMFDNHRFIELQNYGMQLFYLYVYSDFSLSQLEDVINDFTSESDDYDRQHEKIALRYLIMRYIQLYQLGKELTLLEVRA